MSKYIILCILTRFTDNSFLFKSPRVLPSSFFCVLGFCNPMWFKCHTRVCQFLKSTSLYYITIKDQIYNSLYFNCSFFFSHKMIKQVMNEMKTVWKTCPSCYKATNIKMHLVLSFYTILELRQRKDAWKQNYLMSTTIYCLKIKILNYSFHPLWVVSMLQVLKIYRMQNGSISLDLCCIKTVVIYNCLLKIYTYISTYCFSLIITWVYSLIM